MNALSVLGNRTPTEPSARRPRPEVTVHPPRELFRESEFTTKAQRHKGLHGEEFIRGIFVRTLCLRAFVVNHSRSARVVAAKERKERKRGTS
jgi:hypothetical protein